MPLIQIYYPDWLKEIFGGYTQGVINKPHWETPGDFNDLQRVHINGEWDKAKEIHDTLMKGYDDLNDVKEEQPWKRYHEQFKDFRNRYPHLYRTMEVWAWG